MYAASDATRYCRAGNNLRLICRDVIHRLPGARALTVNWAHRNIPPGEFFRSTLHRTRTWHANKAGFCAKSR